MPPPSISVITAEPPNNNENPIDKEKTEKSSRSVFIVLVVLALVIVFVVMLYRKRSDEDCFDKGIKVSQDDNKDVSMR